MSSDGVVASICEGLTKSLINEIASGIDEAARADQNREARIEGNHWLREASPVGKTQQDEARDSQTEVLTPAHGRNAESYDPARRGGTLSETMPGPVAAATAFPPAAGSLKVKKNPLQQGGIGWPYQSIVHKSIERLFQTADLNGDGVVDVEEAYALILLMYGRLRQLVDRCKLIPAAVACVSHR